jgi:dienelactone hydrolase
LALGLAGCSFVPCTSQPRPPLPLSLPIAAAAPAVRCPQLVGSTEDGPGRFRGTLRGAGETVPFVLWRAPGPPRPVVLMVPILARGEALMEAIGQRLFAHGFDVASCERAGEAMLPPQRGEDLQELLRRTVLRQRLVLAWLREGAAEPPPARFVLGVSVGGIVATAVAALEPDLDGTALCLAGGDLADLLVHSHETRVRRWVDWRRTTDGIGTDGLHWDLQRHLDLEPVRLAASVDPRRILFVSAQLDDVVPQRHQDLLWEALGRPDRLRLPLGHYSTALALDPVVTAVADHFRKCLPSTAEPPLATP